MRVLRCCFMLRYVVVSCVVCVCVCVLCVCALCVCVLCVLCVCPRLYLFRSQHIRCFMSPPHRVLMLSTASTHGTPDTEQMRHT